MKEKIELKGFNNLKKQLSFSFYDFVIAPSEEEKLSYVEYINKRYSAKKITELLKKIVDIIEANILDISSQDYEPYGASSMLLLSDIKADDLVCKSVAAHIDKSHITAHTYPDFEGPNGFVSFRVDIDISTCGEIAPLTALDEIFHFFDTDIVVIDYIVRGYTRDKNGEKIYIDHPINSIRDYIADDIMEHFRYKDLILQNDNTWQLKLMRNDYDDIEEFFSEKSTLSKEEKQKHFELLYKEMKEIFSQ